jgi:cytochrome c2
MPSRIIALLVLWGGRAIVALRPGSRLAGKDVPSAERARGASLPARRHMGRIAVAVLFAVLLAAVGVSAALRIKRDQEADALATRLTQGDPRRGAVIALKYGCAGCHAIPGVRGPGGKVGPPLADIGARVYLGGRLTNTPDNLIQWIENPRAVDPQTAMPVTGISKREARDIAAYLLALR